MPQISETMPKNVRQLNRKLKEVIRVLNAMQNVRLVHKRDPQLTGKWIIGEKESVIVME